MGFKINEKYMNQKIVRLGVLIFIAAAAIYFIPHKAQAPQGNIQITDFKSCTQAGNPIRETYPEQCVAEDGTVYVNESQIEAIIDTPQIGELVVSPLTVSGKAKGNWFFEDNIPIFLIDNNGTVLAQAGFHSVDGNWMTEDFVKFTGALEFTAPETDTGFLIIQNDNPSGLPENGKIYDVPVRFR